MTSLFSRCDSSNCSRSSEKSMSSCFSRALRSFVSPRLLLLKLMLRKMPLPSSLLSFSRFVLAAQLFAVIVFKIRQTDVDLLSDIWIVAVLEEVVE